MKTNPAGVALVAASEGEYLTAYKCPAGVLTIGYGHTSAAGAPQVYPGQTITKAEAIAILGADLERFEAVVAKCVKVPLTGNQHGALVSFVFNVGEANFKKSTLLRELNRKNYDAVPAQLLRWNKAKGKVLPGLVKRRHAEAALWNDAPIEMGHQGPIPQAVDAPKKDLSPTVTHVLPTGAAISAVQQIDITGLLHNPTLVHFGSYLLVAVTGGGAGWLIHKILRKG